VRLITKSSLLSIALLSVAGSALATPVAGTFTFGGTAIVGATFLDIKGPGEVSGFGRVDLGDLNTGDFAVLNAIADAKATLRDRNSFSEPADTPLNVPNYIVIDDLPNLVFTLTRIKAGTFGLAQCDDAPANAQQCTPAPDNPFGTPSPYNLSNFTNTAGTLSSSASFTVEGTVVDLANPSDPMATFLGTYTATFNNEPYQDILASLLAGGSRSLPFSAEFVVTAIPEPSTLGITGLALIGLAGVARRLRR
jgi:hypothetical protein